MGIRVEFSDMKACPMCGAPAERLGRWIHERGKWFFKPQYHDGRKTLPFRPDRNGQMWCNFPIRDFDPKTGVEKPKDEWHYPVSHICAADTLGLANTSCGVIHEHLLVPYKGDVLPGMLTLDDAISRGRFDDIVAELSEAMK